MIGFLNRLFTVLFIFAIGYDALQFWKYGISGVHFYTGVVIILAIMASIVAKPTT